MRIAQASVFLIGMCLAAAGPAAAAPSGTGPDAHMRKALSNPLPAGSYRVAQTGIFRFLSKVPKPSLRVIGKVPVPKVPRGLSRGARAAAGSVAGFAGKALPNPRNARRAIRSPDAASGTASIGRLPTPAPRPRAAYDTVPPLKQMAWVNPRSPRGTLPRPGGPRIASQRVGDVADAAGSRRFGGRAASWFKENWKTTAAFTGLALIGVVPGEVVSAIVSEEDEQPADGVE